MSQRGLSELRTPLQRLGRGCHAPQAGGQENSCLSRRQRSGRPRRPSGPPTPRPPPASSAPAARARSRTSAKRSRAPTRSRSVASSRRWPRRPGAPPRGSRPSAYSSSPPTCCASKKRRFVRSRTTYPQALKLGHGFRHGSRPKRRSFWRTPPNNAPAANFVGRRRESRFYGVRIFGGGGVWESNPPRTFWARRWF